MDCKIQKESISWRHGYRLRDIILRDIIRQICEELQIEIIRGSIKPDHIHLFLSIPPNLSVSKVVQYLKGKTSRKLQQEFPSLRKDFWGRHLWAIGYFCVTTGNVTTEMIQQYIEEQAKQPDDDQFFKIVP